MIQRIPADKNHKAVPGAPQQDCNVGQSLSLNCYQLVVMITSID
jgi:hypothetical protein